MDNWMTWSITGCYSHQFPFPASSLHGSVQRNRSDVLLNLSGHPELQYSEGKSIHEQCGRRQQHDPDIER